MAAQYLPNVKATFFDANGNPLVGGKVYTYVSGTSTLQASYSNAAGTVLNSNPVILDARGQADIYLGVGLNYRIVVQNSLNVEQESRDNVFGQGYAGFGNGWFNVVNYGAVGNGVVDDTAAILAAMAAASTANSLVYFPGGTYKITAVLNNSGARANCRGFVGDGANASVISGTTLTGNAIVFTDAVAGSVWRDFSVIGPGQAAVVSSTGLQLLRSNGEATYGTVMSNVRLKQFPTAGLRLQIPITSVFDSVITEECGTYGFRVEGSVSPFVGGTSTVWNGCYANNTLGSGFSFQGHGYFSINGGAADNCNIGYNLSDCFGFSINSAGSEVNTYIDASNPGYGILLNGCYGGKISGLWTYNLPNVASRQIRIVASNRNTITGLSGYSDNSVVPAFQATVADGDSRGNVFIGCGPVLDELGTQTDAFTLQDLGLQTLNIFDGQANGLSFDTPDEFGNSLYVLNGGLVNNAAAGEGGLFVFDEAFTEHPIISLSNTNGIAFGPGSTATDTELTRTGVGALTISGIGAGAGSLTVNNDLTVLDDASVNGDASVVGTTVVNKLTVANQPAITSANLTLTGWSTSTVTQVDAGNTGGTIGLSVNGTPSANPTIRVTYTVAYPSPPHVLVTPLGSSNRGPWTVTTSLAGYFEVSYNGTPAAGAIFAGFTYLVFDV